MAKKILISSFDFPPLWGGVATYSFELANSLAEKGFSVTVVTRNIPGEFQCPENVKVIRHSLGHTGIGSIPKLTWHLFRILKKENFDHIFCCLWLPDGVALHFARKLAKVETPFSISVHGMEIIETKENLKKRLRNKLKPLKDSTFVCAHRIICVSHYTRKLLLSLVPINEDKAIVINNGANPENFSPKTEQNQNFPSLLTACRLQPNKGVDQVLKSLPDLVKKHPNLEYRIAGEGPDKERLEKLSQMMQVQNHVKFLGKIRLESLIEEFQRAHLYIMLSRKERHHVEGFGLVFLEAALCGTPSLGGKSGGIPDAIEEGVTGWLVDPYSEKEITKKLLELLSDPEKLKKTGEAALKKTLESKTWSHRVDQMIREVGLDA